MFRLYVDRRNAACEHTGRNAQTNDANRITFGRKQPGVGVWDAKNRFAEILSAAPPAHISTKTNITNGNVTPRDEETANARDQTKSDAPSESLAPELARRTNERLFQSTSLIEDQARAAQQAEAKQRLMLAEQFRLEEEARRTKEAREAARRYDEEKRWRVEQRLAALREKQLAGRQAVEQRTFSTQREQRTSSKSPAPRVFISPPHNSPPAVSSSSKSSKHFSSSASSPVAKPLPTRPPDAPPVNSSQLPQQIGSLTHDAARFLLRLARTVEQGKPISTIIGSEELTALRVATTNLIRHLENETGTLLFENAADRDMLDL